MSELEDWAKRRLPDEFLAHSIFNEMATCCAAYGTVSDLVFGFMTPSRTLLGNIDSHFFDSLAGTIESSRTALLAGRIADAYTLLRSYSETGCLQIYWILELKTNAERILWEGVGDRPDFESIVQLVLELVQSDSYYLEEFESWMTGKKKSPYLRVLLDRMRSASAVERLGNLFDGQRYQEISKRCNDNVHVNFFRNLRLNNHNVEHDAQMAWLDQFARDFRDLFVRHVAYVFSIRPEYMASFDYISALERGLTPPDDSQYWVAPIVQQVFDEVVSCHRPDVTHFIRENSGMQLTDSNTESSAGCRSRA